MRKTRIALAVAALVLASATELARRGKGYKIDFSRSRATWPSGISRELTTSQVIQLSGKNDGLVYTQLGYSLEECDGGIEISFNYQRDKLGDFKIAEAFAFYGGCLSPPGASEFRYDVLPKGQYPELGYFRSVWWDAKVSTRSPVAGLSQFGFVVIFPLWSLLFIPALVILILIARCRYSSIVFGSKANRGFRVTFIDK